MAPAPATYALPATALPVADGARIATGGGDFSAIYGGVAQTDSISGRIETEGGDLSRAVTGSVSEDTRFYLRGATLLSEGGNIPSLAPICQPSA